MAGESHHPCALGEASCYSMWCSWLHVEQAGPGRADEREELHESLACKQDGFKGGDRNLIEADKADERENGKGIFRGA